MPYFDYLMINMKDRDGIREKRNAQFLRKVINFAKAEAQKEGLEFMYQKRYGYDMHQQDNWQPYKEE